MAGTRPAAQATRQQHPSPHPLRLSQMAKATAKTVNELDPLAVRLDLANRHVAEGETRIARQEALLAEWARLGRDTREVERVLQAMRDTLALMREHQQRLHEQSLREQHEAARTPPPPSPPPPHKP